MIVSSLMISMINGIVLGGQNAFSVAVGVEEALHRVPQLGALFTQFNNQPAFTHFNFAPLGTDSLFQEGRKKAAHDVMPGTNPF